MKNVKSNGFLIGFLAVAPLIITLPAQADYGYLDYPEGARMQHTSMSLFNVECFESITGMSYVMCRFPHPDGGKREVWFEDPSPIYGKEFYFSAFLSNEFSDDGSHEIVGRLWLSDSTQLNIQWFAQQCNSDVSWVTNLDPQGSRTTSWECL